MKRYFLALMVLLTGALAPAAHAQSTPNAQILLVDFERVLKDSLVGKDVALQLDARGQDLQKYRQEIQQNLAKEGDELRGKKSLLSPEDFRAQAQAFEAKGREAETKLRGYFNQVEQGRQRADNEINRALLPIVTKLMEERGGTMVMNKALVYHHSGGIDITTEVIERLNQAKPSFDLALPVIEP